MAKAAKQAYEALRTGILNGEYAFGARLGEAELAEALGVSRTPIREALRRLSSEGLVEVLPNRGARVARWGEKDLAELYELRAMLESYAAARAATRIGQAEIEKLGLLCEEMETVTYPGPDRDFDRLTDLNGQFHSIVLRAADSQRLSELLGAVVHVPLVLRTFHRYTEDALARSMGHHRELVYALGAGEPEWAQSVMHSHIRAARTVLVNAMRDKENE